MAEEAVEFLLENLKQLLLYHAHLILDAENQVERLENSLRLFKTLEATVLRASPPVFDRSAPSPSSTVRELIRLIQHAVYDAEDRIDAYIIHANDKNFFSKAIHTPLKIVDIVEQVEAVVEKFKYIFAPKSTNNNEYTLIEVEDGRQDEIRKHVKQMNMVGLEDDIARLKSFLFEERTELDVITIFGMGGSGKTTLAEKIFNDRGIRFEFPTRMWVNISREFTRKNIFLAMIEEFTILTDDIRSKTEEMLAGLVFGYLEKERFLLVMDDLWAYADWHELRVALPKRNTMGKVLITTRYKRVVEHDSLRIPFQMRSLSEEESFLLLQLETFRDKEFPAELNALGLKSNLCRGHPLTILIVGGILFKEFSSDRSDCNETILGICL